MRDWKEQVKALIDSKATNVIFLVTPDDARTDDLIRYVARDYAIIASYDPYRGLEELKSSFDKLNVDVSNLSPLNPLDYLKTFETTMRQTRGLFIFYNANRLVKDLQFNLLWSAILSIRRKVENYSQQSAIIFIFPNPEDIDAEILQKTFAVKTALPTRDDFLKTFREGEEKRVKTGKKLEVVDGDLTGLLNASSGMSITQFENILIYLCNLYDGKISVSEVMQEKAKIVEASGLISVKRSRYTLEDYAGQKDIKDFLFTRVINIIKEAERARKLGVKIPRGICFEGAPRTGKTFLGECLSGSLSMPVFEIKGSSLVSQWYGQSEQLTQRAIEQIDRNSPSTIIWDEVESWLPSREGQMHEVSARTLSLWMSYLGKSDRENLFLIMTNRPDLIDTAILSAGRVDYVVPFLLPDETQRESVLKVQFGRIQKVPYKDLDFREVARRTDHFNCAELENVVRESALNAFQRKESEVEMVDVEKALEVVTVPLENRLKEERFYRALASKYCNVPTLMRGAKMETREIEETVKEYSRWT